MDIPPTEPAIPRDILSLLRAQLGDQFEIDREIGRGGAARVFAARDTTGRLVALKILHPELLTSTTADRFLREIRLAKQLDHVNIARLLDTGERDWLVYYVMEYIEGSSLRQVLDRVRQLTVEDARRLAADILAGLDHAHHHGIIHRDVKPENVMVTSERAVLVDFGIARAVELTTSEHLTRSGMTVGTSHYMSPEQITGSRQLDARTDLYAVGCVLFECVAGHPPFVSRQQALVMQQHLQAPPPDLGALRPGVPPEMVRAVTRSLAKKPEDRWSSADEMRRVLLGESS